MTIKSKNSLTYVSLIERLCDENLIESPSSAAVMIALVVSMHKRQISVVCSTHIREVFRDNKELIDITRHKHHGYNRYNILSFPDRLTKELKPLEHNGLLTLLKIKNRVHVTLTENGLNIFKKDNFKTSELALWLTSDLVYERDFVEALDYVNSINGNDNEILEAADLAQLSNLLGKTFIAKNKDLYKKLQNSIKFKKVSFK